uniref:uncharacterized protein LOC100183777 isoform X1 n=1 Tax=Ciona intestinalis TaxID=7719 RepID=UPI000EF4464F|nr:uncharacterized protein LOC100183777 isoform X1 [Ciona intestinalis]|eukprot:XP_026690673.1 uncharacterized protein LOC100183777 isoform X1 [Ciona intestinalis]
MNPVRAEIKKCLKTNYDEPTDNLEADIQRVRNAYNVKENIRSVVQSQIRQMQLREQWLLHQVDSVHECLTKIAQKNSEQLAETRGKLLCCLDLMEEVNADNSLSIQKYAKSVLKTYNKMVAQETQNHSKQAISFDYSDMSNKIQKFGSISCKEEDVCCDDTWEFPESENSLDDLDSQEDNCKDCCGSCEPGKEIEDIDQMFGGRMLKDVCRANEVCATHSECLCDQPCYLNAECSEVDHVPTAVLDVEKAVSSIMHEPKTKEQPETPHHVTTRWEDLDVQDSSHVQNNTSSAEEKFQNQVNLLEEQFSLIMSETDVKSDRQESVRLPWSVDEVSAVIDGILSETKEITEEKDVPSKMMMMASSFGGKKGLFYEEKADMEKTELNYAATWTTVDSMHDLLSSILRN